MKILNESQEQVLKRERRFLNDLRVKLVEYGASKEDLRTLVQSIDQLDDLFLLVVVGEFNSGKSAFINALLGEKWLEEGVTPTTSKINILRFGESKSQRLSEESHEVILLPVDMLSEVSIVDTPGTNAIIRFHEELTRKFVPRADLVLFITSVDRPFTESERRFMEDIRDWGKKVVVVINKIDLLQDEAELHQVERFVRENTNHLLAMAPEIFSVSSRLALRAKTGEPELWVPSQFEALEAYIRQTLDQESQLMLKFLNPLGVGAHLMEKTYEAAKAQEAVLEKDQELLRNVDRQQAVYQEDKQKEFNLRMAEIEKIFLEMEQRGDEFFEERFRLARVLDLIKRDRLQTDFEREVVAEVPDKIDGRVDDLIDWLVESDLRQWQAITNYLADRRQEHKGQIIGEGLMAAYNVDRGRLLDAIGREAERVVSSYNKHIKSEQIALEAQNAVAASMAVEIGAVGLGALITALATTAAADITGIVAASLVAVLGFFIIPAQRRKAKRDLHERLVKLRKDLLGTLRVAFEKEVQRSLGRIEEAMAPYSRFVRGEVNRVEEILEEMRSSKMEIEDLHTMIEAW